jgi:HSP20 family protein
MANLIPFNPFREMLSMRDMMNRMFDEAFFRPTAFEGEFGLALDVEAKNDEFIVRANVPGLKPEDLNIEILDNTVTVRGEFKDEKKDEGKNYLMMERRYGQFSRSVTLPAPVVANKAEATVENGILTLRLPKADEAKPKAITVKAK